MGARGAAGPGDVILGGFRTFGGRWGDFLKIGAVTIVPLTVIAVAILTPFTPDLVGDVMANQFAPPNIEERFREVDTDEWIRWGIAYGVYTIVSWIVSTLTFGADAIVAREHVNERSIAWGDALRAALPRLPRLLLIVFLVWLLSLIGLLLCLLPGIWLITSWFVAPVVAIHEDISARRSMGRSFRLVRQRFWPTLLVVLLTFVAMFLLQSGANSVASILLAPIGEGAGQLYFAGLMLFGGVVAVAVVAVLACIGTELYLELVARAEGSVPGVPAPPPDEAFA